MLRQEADPDGVLPASPTSVYEGTADIAGRDRQALGGDVSDGDAP